MAETHVRNPLSAPSQWWNVSVPPATGASPEPRMEPPTFQDRATAGGKQRAARPLYVTTAGPRPVGPQPR